MMRLYAFLPLLLAAACCRAEEPPAPPAPAATATPAAQPAPNAADVPEHGRELQGCWKNDTDNAIVLRFEPHRCSWIQDGRLLLGRATYEAGKVTVNVSGQRKIWGVEIKEGKELWLNQRGKPAKFLKMDGVPKELELVPMTLGEAKPVAAEKLKEIQKEMKERLDADQAVRKKGRNAEEWSRVDTANTEYLLKLVRELGWVDAVRFGAETSHAAFILVQHSQNLPLMLAVRPEIEKDVKAKRLGGQSFALLHDRVQLMTGEKQRYGTQIGKSDKGETVVRLLENKEKVDEFRKELGMTPLAEYLERFKVDNGYLEIKFEEE